MNRHIYHATAQVTADSLKAIKDGFCITTDKALPRAYCFERAKELRKTVVHIEKDKNGKPIMRELFYPNGKGKVKTV